MNEHTVSIDGRRIGADAPVFVIAEIGVNHDGSLRRAMELVELAAACGADAVKLQVFRAATLMHGSAQFAAYQQEQVSDDDPAQMLRRYELPVESIRDLVAFIRRHNMMPIATPFSPPDVDVIAELNLPAIKIASPDLVNWPLLNRARALGMPLIVSTGAATLDEIETTCNWLRGWSSAFALLHCVSSYPTPAADANLRWITELSQLFDVPVGYSDHSTEVMSGALAVAAGAVIIEKHLTYNRGAKGPDHAASADPVQFARYVDLVRQASILRGSAGKRVLQVEQDVRRVSRQSIVASQDIPAGRTLQAEDVTVQRPGLGIPAAEFSRVIGKRATSAIAGGSVLQWEMLAA